MPGQKVALMAALDKMSQELRKSASEVCRGDTTTHPVGNADNGTTSVSEGERSRENESDVKEQVGGDNIEKAPAQGYDANGLADVQSKGGLTATTVGEDSSSEDNYKDKLKDPGTSHPAAVGEKYGKLTYADNVKAASEIGNAILAALAVQPATKKAATQPTTTAATEVASAVDLIKDASVNVEDFLAATISDAVTQADMLGQYLYQFKQASEEIPPEAPMEAPLPEGGGEPAAPPAAELGSDPVTADPAMMGGAGGVPGGPPPGASPGGDPTGGAGAVPQEEALQQLVAGLAEMGITPEMLMQAAQTAPPIPGGTDGEKMAYVANRALEFMRSGKYRFEEAKTAGQRQLRDASKQYIKQVFKI